jgi:hypothetical protein
VCETIRRYLKNKARENIQLKFFKTMSVPVLTYGAETWTLTIALKANKKQQKCGF